MSSKIKKKQSRACLVLTILYGLQAILVIITGRYYYDSYSIIALILPILCIIGYICITKKKKKDKIKASSLSLPKDEVARYKKLKEMEQQGIPTQDEFPE